MKLHRALQTVGKETKIGNIAVPEARKGELVVEPLFVGICGTDLQIIRRQRPDPAEILGHEGIARILKGTESKAISKGSYVVFNPVDPTDQNQILGHNTPGLLQERYPVTEHAVKNDLVVPFPNDISPILGALVEPLGTVVYGHNLVSKVVKQSSITIVGTGAIGIMHALYAKAQGYKRVLLVNASRPHLDWCIQRNIINQNDALLDSDSLPEKILAATNGLGVDAVYMCTSRPNALIALKHALRYVKEGGCIDLVGGIKDGDQIPELPQINDLNAIRRANFCGIPADGYVEKTENDNGKKVYLTGHRGTSLRHFEKAIENLRNNGDIFSKVVSHVISFEAAAVLFNEIAKGPLREFNGAPYIKAVVDMRLADKTIRNI
jgi:threonine dehydrogenase-like Zn-dependent dehydrogenase